MSLPNLIEFVERNGGEVSYEELRATYKRSFIRDTLDAVDQGIAKWTYPEEGKPMFALISRTVVV